MCWEGRLVNCRAPLLSPRFCLSVQIKVLATYGSVLLEPTIHCHCTRSSYLEHTSTVITMYGLKSGSVFHVRGKDQEHRTHLSRTVSLSAASKDISSSPFDVTVFPDLIHNAKGMNERDYVRHNRNATHLFERWRLHTQTLETSYTEQ